MDRPLLEIPASQVPFVMKYFQLLKDFAEETPPGQPLRIDRSIFSSLTDEQLEGFKRLVNHFHTQISRNARNRIATEQATNLRKYYFQRNYPNAFTKKFGHLEYDIGDVIEKFEEIFSILGQVNLVEQEQVSAWAEILPHFSYLESIWDGLRNLTEEQIRTLGQLFLDLSEKDTLEEITVEEARELAELLNDYNELGDDEKLKFLNERKNPVYAKFWMKNASKLENNNLRTMTNYLIFQPNSNSKRRNKKTRKLRRNA